MAEMLIVISDSKPVFGHSRDIRLSPNGRLSLTYSPPARTSEVGTCIRGNYNNSTLFDWGSL